MSDAGLADTRAELTTLRLSLQQKLKQLDQKQEATVAPIAAGRAAADDLKQ